MPAASEDLFPCRQRDQSPHPLPGLRGWSQVLAAPVLGDLSLEPDSSAADAHPTQLQLSPGCQTPQVAVKGPRPGKSALALRSAHPVLVAAGTWTAFNPLSSYMGKNRLCRKWTQVILVPGQRGLGPGPGGDLLPQQACHATP